MIELKSIKKYYKMGDNIVKALDDVSLKVEDGEFVAIIGPSGSGKSTMMNIIGCLDKATSGEYLVDGVEISKYSENQLAFLRNKKMGFIFQGFNLLQNLSAYENVELPLIYQGISSSERKVRVLKSLEMVGMSERMKHKPNELSGGQQQRVAIARALATKPMCILADEPTGNLDSSTGEEIMKILKKLNNEGTTVIIITHNDDIAQLSRRIIHIYDGKIKSDEINENIVSYGNYVWDNENQNNEEPVDKSTEEEINDENTDFYGVLDNSDDNKIPFESKNSDGDKIEFNEIKETKSSINKEKNQTVQKIHIKSKKSIQNKEEQ